MTLKILDYHLDDEVYRLTFAEEFSRVEEVVEAVPGDELAVRTVEKEIISYGAPQDVVWDARDARWFEGDAQLDDNERVVSGTRRPAEDVAAEQRAELREKLAEKEKRKKPPSVKAMPGAGEEL